MDWLWRGTWPTTPDLLAEHLTWLATSACLPSH